MAKGKLSCVSSHKIPCEPESGERSPEVPQASPRDQSEAGAAGHGAEPYLVSPTSPRAQASLRALKSAFECEPILMREGGSIPIVNDFKRILKADSLMLGLALPDDNAHSPNEKFDLRNFAKGQLMSAYLWQELGRL